MADPWAEFRVQSTDAADQWADFRQPRSVADQLTGEGGPRYQTWPERLIRGIGSGIMSGASLPGDVMAGKASPDDTGRVLELATMAAPINPAIRAGDRMVAGVGQALKAEKPAIPTARELADAGGKDIQAAKNSGLEVTSGSVSNYSQKLQQELYDAGINPVDAPATFAKLKELESAPSGSFFTANNLQSLRESFGATAQNFNPAAAKDQLAASRVIKGFDQFLPTIDQKGVLAGTPSETARLFERGRGNYAAGMRSNDITGNLDRATTGILERAEGRAQAANSGRNLDNTIRSKVAAVLEKPKEISGYSDEELAALVGVREGGRGRNTAREIGNLLGGGGGLGATLPGIVAGGSAAIATGNPLMLAAGAVPPIVGTASRKVANVLAKKDLNKVDELLRKRSPLYQERLNNPNMTVVSPERRAAIVRALLMENQQ